MITKRNIWILTTITLLAGIILGLVIASNLDWTKSGIARETPIFHDESKEPIEIKSGSGQPPAMANLDLQSTGKAFVEVSQQVMPTVVSVTSSKVVRVRNPFSEFFRDDLFGRSFRDWHRERRERQEGLGSGVIISSDGYILTNNHVIREAEEISVLIDKKEYKAKVIGVDPKTDLAVIKISAKNLPVVKLGNSDDLQVGEWVLAIGNPFSLQLQHSVTAGIVSGKGRTNVGIGDIDYEDFIQTDAAINPGNSGGALVNLRGELVGINTAIVASSWGGGNLGIGFAIPINLAKQIMEQLIASGKVVRGWLGIYIQTADNNIAEKMNLPSTEGALVSEVTSNSPAEKAGIRNGDFIVEFDGKKVHDSNQLMHLIAGYKPGTRATLKLIRDGREKTLSVTLGERPEQDTPRYSSSDRPGNRLGIEVSNVTEELARQFDLGSETGVVVIDVEPGSLAEKEGIQVGDLIREVNREVVRSVRDFNRIVNALKSGEIVLLRITRGDNNFFVALKVKND
ncbi:MAG: DegQ family serine endoprotease [candidate division KSB1 bacterium]|nr:DegQ family serine endoprotease [candidate division KSB1 bacterium]MDZ7304398.1 DegQ family serine endoprotease [candidate division KSB1 bacterium]MDZ7313348.1 DegQ family serine endoprotease [candidate division KSB1 bacterium]